MINFPKKGWKFIFKKNLNLYKDDKKIKKLKDIKTLKNLINQSYI